MKAKIRPDYFDVIAPPISKAISPINTILESNIMKSLFLTILIIFSSSLAYADVSIMIDTLSNKSNKVEFTVSNTDEKTHYKYQGIHVEKKEKGKWKVLRWHIDCPCNAKCKRVTINLGINESQQHLWDKKDSSCKVVTKGEYRFKIPRIWSENTNKSNLTVNSSEFTLP